MDPADLHFSLLSSMIDGLTTDGCNELDSETRKYCERCERPKNVCLCYSLPEKKLTLKNNIKVWIFQHPAEEKRPLRTARLLEKCLEEKNFQILRSRKFSVEKFPELKNVYRNKNSYVLYPSENAINLDEFKDLIEEQRINSEKEHREPDDVDSHFNLILIDGTWPQASGIYWTNQELKALKQVKIQTDRVSEYTVRTQPRETFLSTLETVSIILSTIEEDENVYEVLVNPLRALCELQFEHGAKPHQSKEYLIFNGLYKRPISKRHLHKLTKDSKFYSEGKQPTNLDIV